MDKYIEQFQLVKSQLLLPIFSDFIKYDEIQEYKKNSGKTYRDRLYPLELTYQTYLFQATSKDKSDVNSLIFLDKYFKNKAYEAEQLEILLKKQAELNKINMPKAKGAPKKKFVKIHKSKTQQISLNTASLNTAKHNFPLQVMISSFKSTQVKGEDVKYWNGHRVFIVDGTTLLTQDKKELREHFMPDNVKNEGVLPIVKLEGMIDFFSGTLVDVAIDNYRSSESRMLKTMYDNIPVGTIVLGDDLYSSYGHFTYASSRNTHIIACGKHKRNDFLKKKISNNEELVEWRIRQQHRPLWFNEEDNLPSNITVRKIRYLDPKSSKEKVIYTTLLDHIKYNILDIIALYERRWDIELCFRDIKVELDLEYLRGHSVDMVLKEIYSHLIVYNIINIIIYSAFKSERAVFSPLREKIQTLYTKYKTEYYNLDKQGRTYSRKSTGRISKSNSQQL